MTKAETYYKWTKLTVGVIIAAVILIFLFRQCGHSGNVGVAKSDTIKITQVVTVHDTTTLLVDKPKPYKVTLHDTLEVSGEPQYIYLPSNQYPPIVNNALQDYNSTKYYNDTFNVQYGYVIAKDTIRKNLIIGRSISLKQTLTDTTRTITVKEDKRNVWYLGGGAFGNLTTPFYGVQSSIGLTNKQDIYYGITGMLLLKSQQPMYGVEIKMPIHLKKKG